MAKRCVGLINKLLKCSNCGITRPRSMDTSRASMTKLNSVRTCLPVYIFSYPNLSCPITGCVALKFRSCRIHLPICFPKNNYFSEHPRPTSPSRASGGKVSNITCSQARDLVHEEARGMANTSCCQLLPTTHYRPSGHQTRRGVTGDELTTGQIFLGV